MNYPTLHGIPTEKRVISEFLGYDHVLRPGEGEWFDMENLSSDGFPVMRTRKRRGLVRRSLEKITGVIAREGLCWTAGSRFYHNGQAVELGLTEEPKQLVSMGAYILILPDRKWVNTVDLSFGDVDCCFTAPDAELRLCTLEGDDLPVDHVGSEEPNAPENGSVWLDTGTVPHSLKKYSAASALWVSLATTYVRISAPGIGRGFGLYDGIRLEGLAGSAFDDLRNLDGAAIVWNKGEDYLVVVGLLEEVRRASVTVSRRMPEMDFVVESGNRLWGCRYGPSADGQVVNEIYASKLGDFRNWSCYMGISTDSYTVSIGSDGPFTGAITHGGYPLFFKENFLHKVYGQIPANFQVQSTACRGVQQGSGESLAIVNEVLYYLGTSGVCAYDGSLPVEVSSQFGAVRCHAGAAAGGGNKYYLRALENDDTETVFVLDTARGMWHRESGCGAERLRSVRGDVLAVREHELVSLLGSGDETDEPDFTWMAETGILGAVSMNGKNLARVAVRLAMEAGSTLRILAQYDSIGPWQELGRMKSRRLKAFTIPVPMQRCDHLRLRLEGDGDCTVYALMMEMEGCTAGGNSDGLVVG